VIGEEDRRPIGGLTTQPVVPQDDRAMTEPTSGVSIFRTYAYAYGARPTSRVGAG
jgi:hypothetical protein